MPSGAASAHRNRRVAQPAGALKRILSRPGRGVARTHALVRRRIPHLARDRWLRPELDALDATVDEMMRSFRQH